MTIVFTCTKYYTCSSPTEIIGEKMRENFDLFLKKNSYTKFRSNTSFVDEMFVHLLTTKLVSFETSSDFRNR